MTLLPFPGLDKTSPEFRAELVATAQRLGIDPNHLAAVICIETGRTWSPSVRNPYSGAVGLIQFMPSTAKALGTSLWGDGGADEGLAGMTAVEQLAYVEKYFRKCGALPRIRPGVVGDVYMAVFNPAHVGKSPAHVLYRKGEKGYDQNVGLDKDKNGRITVGDVWATVEGVLVRAHGVQRTLDRWEANRCGPADVEAACADIANPDVQRELNAMFTASTSIVEVGVIEPADVPPISDDRIVDGTEFMHWLETGEGDPWSVPAREIPAGPTYLPPRPNAEAGFLKSRADVAEGTSPPAERRSALRELSQLTEDLGGYAAEAATAEIPPRLKKVAADLLQLGDFSFGKTPEPEWLRRYRADVAALWVPPEGARVRVTKLDPAIDRSDLSVGDVLTVGAATTDQALNGERHVFVFGYIEGQGRSRNKCVWGLFEPTTEPLTTQAEADARRRDVRTALEAARVAVDPVRAAPSKGATTAALAVAVAFVVGALAVVSTLLGGAP